MNYETLEKYQAEEDFFEQVENFLEWLEENYLITLEPFDRHNVPPINVRDLLFEYAGIDKAQLERERRRLLAEQRALGG